MINHGAGSGLNLESLSRQRGGPNSHPRQIWTLIFHFFDHLQPDFQKQNICSVLEPTHRLDNGKLE